MARGAPDANESSMSANQDTLARSADNNNGRSQNFPQKDGDDLDISPNATRSTMHHTIPTRSAHGSEPKRRNRGREQNVLQLRAANGNASPRLRWKAFGVFPFNISVKGTRCASNARRTIVKGGDLKLV